MEGLVYHQWVPLWACDETAYHGRTVWRKRLLDGTQRDMASDYTEEKVITNTVAVYELILKYNNEIEKAKKQKRKRGID